VETLPPLLSSLPTLQGCETDFLFLLSIVILTSNKMIFWNETQAPQFPPFPLLLFFLPPFPFLKSFFFFFPVLSAANR